MSREKNVDLRTETAENAVEERQEIAKTQEERAKAPTACVYCGPSVRGIARQYTVYTGGLPQEAKAFIAQHKAAKALFVPLEQFAKTRRALETAGTAEAIIYQKIKEELKGER